jgi:hypothetical protein
MSLLHALLHEQPMANMLREKMTNTFIHWRLQRRPHARAAKPYGVLLRCWALPLVTPMFPRQFLSSMINWRPPQTDPTGGVHV